MTEIHKDLENAAFIQPEGVIKKTVCTVSGKLATEACGSNVYSELFTEELVPTETCEGHGQIRVCNDSKQLATSQCPNVIDTMGYIPEKERNAVWVTQNALSTEITGSCPLHPEPSAPTETVTPNTTTDTTNNNNNNTPNTAVTCSHNNKSTTTTNATCGAAGSTVVKCKDCGKTLSNTSISATGNHTPGNPVVTNATCSTAGSTVVNCSVCGKNISNTPIPATGNHSYSNGTCTVCGAKDPNYVEPQEPVQPEEPTTPEQPTT